MRAIDSLHWPTVALALEVGASVLLAATGQVLFKVAVTGRPLTVTALANPTTLLAFAAYGASAILWIVVLAHIPLAVAYPFVSLNFIFVALAAWLFLHEPMSWRQIAGLVFVLAGVTFVARG